MNSNIMKSFSVFGLFGTDDVRIPFDTKVKVLIGKNGLGGNANIVLHPIL